VNDEEVLYGRPARLKVFISSEMRSHRLDAERVAAAEAAEETGWHFAWYWERDANAGPYSSAALCLHQARTSDRLVLILGSELTPITRQEYEEARGAGVACFVLVQSGVTRSAEAQAFLDAENSRIVYKAFGSSDELRTALVDALLQHAAMDARRAQLARRAALPRDPELSRHWAPS
jgi:hypothetical protein